MFAGVITATGAGAQQSSPPLREVQWLLAGSPTPPLAAAPDVLVVHHLGGHADAAPPPPRRRLRITQQHVGYPAPPDARVTTMRRLAEPEWASVPEWDIDVAVHSHEIPELNAMLAARECFASPTATTALTLRNPFVGLARPPQTVLSRGVTHLRIHDYWSTLPQEWVRWIVRMNAPQLSIAYMPTRHMNTATLWGHYSPRVLTVAVRTHGGGLSWPRRNFATGLEALHLAIVDNGSHPPDNSYVRFTAELRRWLSDRAATLQRVSLNLRGVQAHRALTSDAAAAHVCALFVGAVPPSVTHLHVCPPRDAPRVHAGLHRSASAAGLRRLSWCTGSTTHPCVFDPELEDDWPRWGIVATAAAA